MRMKKRILISMTLICALVLPILMIAQNNATTKEIPAERVIKPYNIEVCYDKTVHILFPNPVLYIDLGSPAIIAGKADVAENVVRVKSAEQSFENETNFSVITNAGDFYSFIVTFNDNPEKLNFEMKDFTWNANDSLNNGQRQDIFLSGLGETTPDLINLVMKNIYDSNKPRLGITNRSFGIKSTLRSFHSHSGILYCNIAVKNKTNIAFDIDLITFKIADKKVSKRTAIQETIIKPIRVYNHVTKVQGKSNERMVFAFEKFTIPNDKQLVIEIFEKNGGRHQRFIVRNSDLVRAETIEKLKCKE